MPASIPVNDVDGLVDVCLDEVELIKDLKVNAVTKSFFQKMKDCFKGKFSVTKKDVENACDNAAQGCKHQITALGSSVASAFHKFVSEVKKSFVNLFGKAKNPTEARKQVTEATKVLNRDIGRAVWHGISPE